MKHLGDITKISGYTAPIVDCIVGGSPCQDLSVAGKRAGLDGERSGLYIEQVRIVKEMRERDERNGRTGVDIRPRYMVWENVPGAFSSNKGEDFRIVLEELAKVKDKDAVIPLPDTGKWTNHGCVMGDGWSIAWRVLDAQFWGVPQRRRRIALVADFGGQSAPEILFVRESVSGHSDESQQTRKATPDHASGGIGADDSIGVDIYNTQLTGDKACPLTAGGTSSTGTCPKVMTPVTFEPGIASREGGHIYEGVSGTLRANAGDNQMATAYGISSYHSNSMKSDNPHSGIYEADTSRTLDANCGNPACNQGGIAIVETVPYTLKIRSGCEGGGKGALVQEDLSATLATNNDQYLFQPVAAYNIGDRFSVPAEHIDVSPTLTARMGTGGNNVPAVTVPTDSFQPVCFPAHGFGNYEEMNAVGSLMCGQNQTVRGDTPLVVQRCFSKSRRAQSETDYETWVESDTANTLNAFDASATRTTEAVVYALDRASFNQGKNAQFDFEVSDKGVNSPLVAKGPGAVCYAIDQQGGKGAANFAEDVMPTICSDSHGTPHAVCYPTVALEGNGQRPSHKGDGYAETDKSYTLNTTEVHGVCYSIDQGGGKSSVDVREDQSPTLTTTHHGAPAVCYEQPKTRYIVRRLTPLECERLQGYPDGWTDIGEWTDTNGKKRQTSDAARYKALGNSIALPPWKWVLKRICACYERDATMASLFDGIGGFPYLWEQLNGKGTCLWASEIEEFPIAVTKVRIGGNT